MDQNLNHMEPRPGGIFGLIFLSVSWIFTYLQQIGKSDISFVLSSAATILAIIYYSKQIKKLNKK